MADAAKKKRQAQSPDRGAASKRSRVHSVSPSTHSQSTRHDRQSSSANQSNNARFVENPAQATSLPTAEDWTFRIKVLTSATDLENDLFKDAVRGLVRMCFPDGVLEQLGPSVVQRHMREFNAEPANIQNMSKVFEQEMVQRLISLLVKYLDTPAKVVSAVRDMVAATERAHSASIGDVVGQITNGLAQLSETALDGATNWLTGSDTHHDVPNGDENTNPNSAIIDEPSRPRKIKKSQKNSKPQKSTKSQDDGNELEDGPADVDLSTTKMGKNKQKDRKISSTWDWNVDPNDITGDAIAQAFPRTADLFAYHALPITKRKLGPHASRKDLRVDMQSILNEMHQEDFDKWAKSLENLINGDRLILVRVEPVIPNDNELSRQTPPPVPSKVVRGHGDILERSSAHIKREFAESSGETLRNMEHASSNAAVAQATAISRHLSTEDSDFEPPIASVEAADENHGRGSQTNEVIDSAFGMPVLQLLWGSDTLTPEQCISDGGKITDTIMHNLQRRVSADRIVVSGLGGANKTRTKSELQNSILHSFPIKGQSFSYMRIKKNIEMSLVPWVVAEPKAFPELKAMSFVFAHTMPSVLVVLNLLFGSWLTVSMLSGSQMWEEILRALQQRGISEASVGAANIDCLQIDSLCNDRRHPETTRRALLERVLRRLAFSHRDRFMELKVTPVVKTWERKTGLTW